MDVVSQRWHWAKRRLLVYWHRARMVIGSSAVWVGFLLTVLSISGVVTLVSPFGGSPPPINLGAVLDCNVNIEPVVHVLYVTEEDRKYVFSNNDSQILVALQLFGELSEKKNVCSRVMIYADNEIISPSSIAKREKGTKALTSWFYADGIDRGFKAVPLKTTASASGALYHVSVDGDALEDFTGSILLEFKDAVGGEDWVTDTFGFSLLLANSDFSTKANTEEANDQLGVSIVLPAGYRLVQEKSIPSPINQLSSTFGQARSGSHPRYEFLLKESLLGNKANGGHWYSFKAVIESSKRAELHETLLFIFSGSFGLGIGLFFEGLFKPKPLNNKLNKDASR